MRNFIISSIFAICAGLFGFNASAAEKTVAIFVEGNISDAQKSIIQSAMKSELSANKEYKAFENNDVFVKAVESEHDYKSNGRVSYEQICEIGKRFNVDYVITVCTVISDDNEIQMSGRMINVGSGELKSYDDISSERYSNYHKKSPTIKNIADNLAWCLVNVKITKISIRA